jgi:hypothetical protein
MHHEKEKGKGQPEKYLGILIEKWRSKNYGRKEGYFDPMCCTL